MERKSLRSIALLQGHINNGVKPLHKTNPWRSCCYDTLTTTQSCSFMNKVPIWCYLSVAMKLLWTKETVFTIWWHGHQSSFQVCVSCNFKPPKLKDPFNIVTCSEVRIPWEQEKTGPDSPPLSHRANAHPGGLVVANVRASSRQSPGTVVGAGCLAQSNTPFIFSPC